MTQVLDLGTTIIGAFLSIELIGLAVVIVLAFALARWFSNLPASYQAGLVAFLILGGLVLIITVVGLEIGALSILLATFLAIFGALQGKKIV